MSTIDWIKLFCDVDDFCKKFEPKWHKTLLHCSVKKRDRHSGLCLSEIMTILIAFHYSNLRSFKHFYLLLLMTHRTAFPGLVSYPQFVTLMKSALIPLMAFLKFKTGNCTGISIIDATPIVVCHNKRIYNHKVFAGLAKIGKSTMGWFFGFKLHIIINELGELLAFKLTPGNVDDRSVVGAMSAGLIGKLFGDKGYISSKLFKELLRRGLHLVTQIRSNMKNKLMPLMDRLILRKRSLIETVYHQLKDVMQVEHTRHRSPINFIVNMLSGLAAYTLYENKPKMRFNFGGPQQKMLAA